jgi:hypothetical protein
MRNTAMRKLRFAITASLVAASCFLPAAAVELTTQNSSQNGVSVAVTPRTLSSDAETWEFNIVLDTHSQDLSDDLAKSVVLLDGSGARYEPVAWDGAGPGGHHREGVLRFRRITPQPGTIELLISRNGESGARVFRWELK